MTTPHRFRYAGWFANASATATIVSFITAILFFSVGQPFGTINDISSVFQVLLMLPLVFVFYRLFRSNTRVLSALALTLGVIGILVSATGQSLLVVGILTYQQSLMFFPAGAAIGAWLLLTNYQALINRVWRRGLAWTGFLAGIGYLLTVAGFLLGGQENPVFYTGGFVLVIAYSIWAIWLGRVFSAGQLM